MQYWIWWTMCTLNFHMHEYLVSGEKEIKEGQTTYFKSVGMGLFDVCIAQKLYEVAKEK